jgi:hypothetical protein
MATAPHATAGRAAGVRLSLLAAATLVGAAALAGCSAGGSGGDLATDVQSGSNGGALTGGESKSQPAGRSSALSFDAVNERASGGRPLLPTNLTVQHAVIQRASLTVATKDVGAALTRAEAIVNGTGGFVAIERTEASRQGQPRYSTLTVRVPVDDFDDVLAELGALGTLEQQSRSAKDVTGEVVDVESRLASAEESIKRIRLLLGRAQNLGDVIRLESELSSRQADLEALEAQRSFYADQTSLATIDLTLLSRHHVAPPTPEPDDAGFLAGLAAGWRALLGFLTGGATVLGAMLPFAVLALIVGLPLWLLLRALWQRRLTPAPAAADGGSTVTSE